MSFSSLYIELRQKDPCRPLAHRGSSTVGEGHQEHHRGPGTMCLQHWSWGQLLKGKILSWVFIILGGSAQGGRRRRREWVGG